MASSNPPARNPTKFAYDSFPLEAHRPSSGWGRSYLADRNALDRELIYRYLTSAQIEQAMRTGYVPVRGSKGGNWWVLLDGSVLVGPERRYKVSHYRTWCFQVSGNVSDTDTLIAKVLLLQADERHVHMTAL